MRGIIEVELFGDGESLGQGFIALDSISYVSPCPTFADLHKVVFSFNCAVSISSGDYDRLLQRMSPRSGPEYRREVLGRDGL